jgi:plastocyanin
MPRPRPTTLAAWLATMTLVLAACGGTGETTAPPDNGGGNGDAATPTAEDGGETGNTVSMAGNAFSPRSLTVAVGDTVTFTNTGSHTVTEGSNGTAVDDPIVDETGGADIEVTFDEPGRYNITCKIHPTMNMTITVEG